MISEEDAYELKRIIEEDFGLTVSLEEAQKIGEAWLNGITDAVMRYYVLPHIAGNRKGQAGHEQK